MTFTVDELLRQAIEQRSLELNFSIENAADLVNAGFLLSQPSGTTYRIDTQSTHFVESAIQILNHDLGVDVALSVIEGMEVIDRYENYLKEQHGNRVYNAFHFFIYPLKTQLLVKIHREGHQDILNFYHQVSEDRIKFDHWRFSGFFFKALLQLPVSAAEVAAILNTKGLTGKEESEMHEKTEFAISLAHFDYNRAVALYEYGKSNGLQENMPVFALLLAGLHNAGFMDAEQEANHLLSTDPEIAIIFYGAINKRSPALNAHILGLAKHFPPTETMLIGRYIYTVIKLLRDRPAADTVTSVFDVLLHLLRLNSESITNRVIGELIWVDAFEEERFALLRTALIEGLVKLAVVKSYFRTFKDPGPFFNLFEQCCHQFASKLPLKLFENGYDHFLRVSPELSIHRIMILLTHDELYPRKAILSLWIFSRVPSKTLSLLSLATEKEQLRAAEAIFSLPLGLAQMIALAMELRASPFPAVVSYTQHSLCTLVFEAYHDHALSLIKKEVVDTPEDNSFIAPILEAYNAYEELRRLKTEIKDLDPRANEKSLMQLYYQLEREQHANTMNSLHGDENSFMNLAKTTQIVRGNAWKIEGRDVQPLGTFEHSFAMDARMFKNPDQFEINQNFSTPEF